MMPNPIVISNRNIVFVDPKEFDDPEVCDGLKDISNESMDFSDPKEFDDPQVFNDPNGISIGSMNFDNPKVYGLHWSCFLSRLILQTINVTLLLFV